MGAKASRVTITNRQPLFLCQKSSTPVVSTTSPMALSRTATHLSAAISAPRNLTTFGKEVYE